MSQGSRAYTFEELPTGVEPADILLSCALDIKPEVKDRPRIGYGNRIYTPQKTVEFEQRVAWLVKPHVRKLNEIDDLGVFVKFHVHGRQRRDIDNMVKALFDGCNKIAWRDDSQVIRLQAELYRDSPDPRIELLVYIAERRISSCDRCGKDLTPRQVGLRQVLCSKSCYDEIQRKGTYRACAGCGGSVYRTKDKAEAKKVFCTTECQAANRSKCRECCQPVPANKNGRNFCSTDCSISWHRKRPTNSKVAGNCKDCSRPVSRSADRCRACHVELTRSKKESCQPSSDLLSGRILRELKELR